jgi:GTP-binding protein
MNITSAKFVKGVVQGDEFWSKDKTQFAFYGRSNAGKSSSINALLGRNSLAHPSSTPGKTREINFYDINEEFYFVDLPGYGYAKMSKAARETLRHLILWFVTETHVKKRIHVIVIDAKVGLTDFDREMVSVLRQENQEHIFILLNKIDKMNQKDTATALKKAQADTPPGVTMIPFSAVKKKGVAKFWETVQEIQ